MSIQRAFRVYCLGAALFQSLGAAVTANASISLPVQGCNSPNPVLEQTIPTSVGEWPLPRSAEHLDSITRARLSVALVAPHTSERPWVLHVSASFDDPMPVGLAYSFEKLSLSWSAQSGQTTALLDWTQACTQVARDLYPGQTWELDWEIPGTQGLAVLEQPQIALWGGRY